MTLKTYILFIIPRSTFYPIPIIPHARTSILDPRFMKSKASNKSQPTASPRNSINPYERTRAAS